MDIKLLKFETRHFSLIFYYFVFCFCILKGFLNSILYSSSSAFNYFLIIIESILYFMLIIMFPIFLVLKLFLSHGSLFLWVQFSSAQLLSRVWLFVTPWTAAHQASLSFTNSQSLLNLMSIKLVTPSNQQIHPTNSSSVIPFSSCPQSLPASGSFQMSQLFASGGQSIRVSASISVLTMNIQDSFPLGRNVWISLQSKGLSRVLQHHSSKASIFRRSAFFTVQLSHPYMNTGKTIALTR